MTKEDAVKHDRIRELILISLSEHHPNSLDSVMLRRMIIRLGYPIMANDLTSYVAYLEEKELVKIDRHGSGILLVRITAKGLDVLDGRINEVGVGE